jgi:F-type H+-transporting ATPase subunit gamma
MATVQQLQLRIRSIKNTRKITSAMKMVAACKLKAAQDQLDAARDFQAAIDKAMPKGDEGAVAEQPLYIGISADKGLCGAINSSIVRAMRDDILADPNGANGSIYMIGEKAKQGLTRQFGKQMVTTVAECGGLSQPTFNLMGVLADYWSNIEHDKASVYFQYFRSMIAYDTTKVDFWSWSHVQNNLEAFSEFEMEGDPDILQNLTEFGQAVKLYYFLAENMASTLSSRMQAMENSTKNAGEIVDKLEILMNRTRQAKITTELTEIISGAAAVEG